MPTVEKAKYFILGFAAGIEIAVSIIGVVYLATQLAH